jgi:uncharacterized membrane protein YcaP (DUF421 family)
MSRQSKWHLFVSIFLVCWILYFSLPCFIQDCPIVRFTDIFEDQLDNFMVMIVANLIIALVFTYSVDLLYRSVKKLKWFRPKIGEVLINRGYITEVDLKQALGEQKLRIGEMLLGSGKITEEELMDALHAQRDYSEKKLGEILQERGYARHEDIRWALQRMRRRLGEVLVDKGVITTHDLNIVLGRIWYAQYKGF